MLPQALQKLHCLLFRSATRSHKKIAHKPLIWLCNHISKVKENRLNRLLCRLANLAQKSADKKENETAHLLPPYKEEILPEEGVLSNCTYVRVIFRKRSRSGPK